MKVVNVENKDPKEIGREWKVKGKSREAGTRSEEIEVKRGSMLDGRRVGEWVAEGHMNEYMDHESKT